MPSMQMIMLLMIGSSSSVTNFFPTVVATLGYNKIISLLLTTPPYLLAVIASIANAWHADRTGERYLHSALPLWLGMVAFIIASVTTATVPRYIAMMLMVPGIYTGCVVMLAWISNTIPRPPAKRAAALAAINAITTASSIYSSYMYPESAGPRYVVAMSVNCATLFVAFCMATWLRFMLVGLNKKLDEGTIGVESIQGVPAEGAKNGFRYNV